jgi:hypothetical protein
MMICKECRVLVHNIGNHITRKRCKNQHKGSLKKSIFHNRGKHHPTTPYNSPKVYPSKYEN